MRHGTESRPPGPRLAAAALILAVTLLTPTPSPGRTLGRVTLPDKIKVSGKQLQLVGLGRRRGFFNTRYVVGLYLIRPPKGDQAVVGPNQIKQIRIEFRAGGITRARFLDALHQGLYDNNSPATLKKIAPQIKKFLGLLAGIKTERRGRLVLTYLPGKGTAVFFGRERLGLIKGHDFMTALFSVWLGENPVSPGLKGRLLGQKP